MRSNRTGRTIKNVSFASQMRRFLNGICHSGQMMLPAAMMCADTHDVSCGTREVFRPAISISGNHAREVCDLARQVVEADRTKNGLLLPSKVDEETGEIRT